ncbi:MAG: cytochrome B5 [bacterium]|nr:cytochrome B5 [bacterium]
MKKFTREELKRYNGIDDPKIYIAYKGYVYDVTESFLWKGGRHQAIHHAGLDLTSEIRNAPHGEEFILKFPVVGILVD